MECTWFFGGALLGACFIVYVADKGNVTIWQKKNYIRLRKFNWKKKLTQPGNKV